ncbi:peptidylprolyl isomerase [Aggregatimonas sangjinii]|uniref:Peptidyl-prolyl cis-trans isomerase n=1 Tax=Aggregatimonas sangjinii TaxID=2583587 RepID=A0A5B7SL85_9FLAO|nr:peptidylprolyl isomerase [Aggregatimonas sangjinii]QCW99324.1 peptidylprolyl isomerase [Aggregatimonas sangjinii]
MYLKKVLLLTIIPLFFLGSCKEEKQIEKKPTEKEAVAKDSILTNKKKKKEEPFELTEENAIDFFFDYQKGLQENRIKVTTNHGEFIIELFDNVPYHKANFIYLTKQGYFDNTQFHRVVENFIIQGGNSDDQKTADKRGEIGRYLLPPDTRKGHKHHRGTVSMPSSEINNPHMLASPYEFFIVVTDPGSYHLDGDYTPFGRVISGMDVVDAINKQPVGKGDWPSQNVYIEKVEVLE